MPNLITNVNGPSRSANKPKGITMKQISIGLMLALLLTLTACNRDQEPAAAPAKADEAPAAAVVAEPAPEPIADVEAEADDAAAEDQADQLVALVNQRPVTEGQVRKMMNMVLEQVSGMIPEEELARRIPGLREKIIEEIIMQQVLLSVAAQEGLSISETEFNETLNEMAAELPPEITVADFKEKMGFSDDDLREQMLIRKLMMSRAQATAVPSEDEMRAFYDENSDGFSQGETVAASHILFRVDPDAGAETKAEQLERIQNLRAQLLDGADFAELAGENSDCPSKSSGGDLDLFGRGQMVPEFEDAAFSLPVGSISEPVETAFGYHLIKVTEKNEAKTLAFEDVRERIRDMLQAQNQQESVVNYLDGLRKNAVIERFDEVPSGDVLESDEIPVVEAEFLDGPDANVHADAEEDTPAETLEEVIEETSEAVEEAAGEAVEAAEELSEAAADAAAEAAEETVEAAEEAAEEASDLVDNIVAASKAVVEDVVETVEDAAEAVAEKAETVAEKVTDLITETNEE